MTNCSATSLLVRQDMSVTIHRKIPAGWNMGLPSSLTQLFQLNFQQVLRQDWVRNDAGRCRLPKGNKNELLFRKLESQMNQPKPVLTERLGRRSRNRRSQVQIFLAVQTCHGNVRQYGSTQEFKKMVNWPKISLIKNDFSVHIHPIDWSIAYVQN